jgi:hypothetical protein
MLRVECQSEPVITAVNENCRIRLRTLIDSTTSLGPFDRIIEFQEICGTAKRWQRSRLRPSDASETVDAAECRSRLMRGIFSTPQKMVRSSNNIFESSRIL